MSESGVRWRVLDALKDGERTLCGGRVGEMELGGVRSCALNLDGAEDPPAASRGLGMITKSDWAANAAAMLEMGTVGVADMMEVGCELFGLERRGLSIVAKFESAGYGCMTRSRRTEGGQRLSGTMETVTYGSKAVAVKRRTERKGRASARRIRKMEVVE